MRPNVWIIYLSGEKMATRTGEMWVNIPYMQDGAP